MMFFLLSAPMGVAIVIKLILLVSYSYINQNRLFVLGLIQQQPITSFTSRQRSTSCSKLFIRNSSISRQQRQRQNQDRKQQRRRLAAEEDHREGTSSSSSSKPKRIEFENFWGAKLTDDDNDDVMAYGKTSIENLRKVPYIETLDPIDGPFPPGSYVMEGKQEYDAKPTCRLSLAIRWGGGHGGNTMIMASSQDEIIKRMQRCVDSGFNTFQLYRQNQLGLHLIKQMKKETPSYVQTHWSLRMSVPNVLSMSGLKNEVRQTVVQLIDQTTTHNYDDAIDTLQLIYNPQSPYFLDTLDCLTDLQREGLVRSVGVHNVPIKKLREAVTTAGFHSLLDFQKLEGNLLLPPSNESYYPELNIWMADSLADNVLSINQRRSNNNFRRVESTSQERILREWATRRHGDDESFFSSRELWEMHQQEILEPLQWIALKHRVSVSAVALRWVLECGGDKLCYDDGHRNHGKGIVSSAIVDCIIDTEDFGQNVEYRQTFRFALDEEDKEMLQRISAPTIGELNKQDRSVDEFDTELEGLNDWERELILYQKELAGEDELDDYPGIDFNNKALWL